MVAVLVGWGGKMADGKSFVEVEVGEDNGWKQKSETTLDLQLFCEFARQQPGWLRFVQSHIRCNSTPSQILHKLAKTKVVRKTMEMPKRKMRVVTLVRVLANLK